MAAGAKKHDERNHGAFLIISLIVFIVPWLLMVPFLYKIPKGLALKVYYYSILATPKVPALWLSLLFGLIVSIALFIYLIKVTKTNFEGAAYVSKLRGVEMINAANLEKITSERGTDQLKFCGVSVPSTIKNLHYLVTGSTGSGKSVLIASFIDSIKNTGRIICVDPNGSYLKNFYKKGDVILNPFDARGAGWSIFNEIKSRFDVEQFAVSIIPKSPDTQHESFNAMARVLVSETMLKIWEGMDEETDANAELFYWLNTAPTEDLFKFLEDTPAQSLFGAAETYGSIKSVLTQYIKPHKYLSEGDFSIREFLENPKGGNLWITWRQDQLVALKPLISCWVDVICASLLSMPDNDGSRKFNYLILDELDSLDKLNYIVEALTKGRKPGLIAFAGAQSLAQLDKTYGEKEALTLRNSFSTNAVCQIASGDTYTAEQYSKIFGQHEVLRHKDNFALGSSGGRGSRQLEKETEYIILPSQISSLERLEFYFKFAQMNYVCKTKMNIVKRPVVTDGFIMADNQWTEKK